LKICREDKADALTKLAKKIEEVAVLRKDKEELKRRRKLDRKLIHKQAGKIAGMELTDEHFSDEDDEDDV